MTAGRPKEIEGKLMNFNTKIEEQTKQLIDALVTTGTFTSKRELIDYWLGLHKKDNPESYEKAQQFIDFMGRGE
jgi:hypothetical protein